jgi:hypothetical protein
MIESYHHYIFCWDCNTMNEPRPLQLSYEGFRRKMVDHYRKGMIRRFDVKELEQEYIKFDAFHHTPEQFFDSNGLYCYACGSSNIELKCLDEIV